MKQPRQKPPAADIPNPEQAPAVVEARARLDAITAKLADTRQQRQAIERDLGTTANVSDEVLEARLLAEDQPADNVRLLRELRRDERVQAQAAELVAGKVEAARQQAVRELTPVARQQVFVPAARAAVAVWLDAVRRLEEFRGLVEAIRDRNVGNGLYSPFNGDVPLSLADPERFAGFARELVAEGIADKDQVNDLLPGTV